jgi:hypothetical protein
MAVLALTVGISVMRQARAELLAQVSQDSPTETPQAAGIHRTD